VRDLLQMIFERQLLRGKEDLDVPLEPDERVRLRGLERLLAGSGPAPSQRRFVRVAWRMDVRFTRPGGFGAGEIEDLSAGGARVRCPRPPAPGTRLVVWLEDPARGLEYVFPCAVVWRGPRGRAAGVMGVRFDGVPSCGPTFGEEISTHGDAEPFRGARRRRSGARAGEHPTGSSQRGDDVWRREAGRRAGSEETNVA
jgi:hypothetical protein